MIGRQFFLSVPQIVKYTDVDSAEILTAITSGQLPARQFLKAGPRNTVTTSYRVAQDDLVVWLRSLGRLFDDDGMAIRTERRGPQVARMRRVKCEVCGLTLRMATVWIDATDPRCFNPNCERQGARMDVEGVTREVCDAIENADEAAA